MDHPLLFVNFLAVEVIVQANNYAVMIMMSLYTSLTSSTENTSPALEN